jgi:hypothetical protein
MGHREMAQGSEHRAQSTGLRAWSMGMRTRVKVPTTSSGELGDKS